MWLTIAETKGIFMSKNKVVYIVEDYSGKGQRIGAFRTVKKMINYLKWWTDCLELQFHENDFDDDKPWLEINDFQKSKHYLTRIREQNKNENISEQNIFLIRTFKFNPEMDDVMK